MYGPEHEHHRRLDHRLPRGAGRLHRARRCSGRRRRARSRARGRGRASTATLQPRFAGTAWTACDSWYRDAARPDRRQLAGLHARVPGAHADLRPRPSSSCRERLPPSVPVAVVRVKRIVPAAACEPVTVSVPLDAAQRARDAHAAHPLDPRAASSVEPLPVTVPARSPGSRKLREVETPAVSKRDAGERTRTALNVWPALPVVPRGTQVRQRRGDERAGRQRARGHAR